MLKTLPILLFAIAIVGGLSESMAQDKERVGAVIGVLKARKDAKNGRSVILEIQGDGEEKARTYFVAYNPNDPKAKAPFEILLASVNTAKIGDRVQCDWVNTPKGSEGGFFLTTFKVLKKADPKDKKKSVASTNDTAMSRSPLNKWVIMNWRPFFSTGGEGMYGRSLPLRLISENAPLIREPLE